MFQNLIAVRLVHLFNSQNFAPADWFEKNDINDSYGDQYTYAFFPTAESLTKCGNGAAASKQSALASQLYLRAACLYRIARFPYISAFPTVNSESKWQAWQMQKEVYMKAASTWEEPVTEVLIPHTAAEDRIDAQFLYIYPLAESCDGRRGAKGPDDSADDGYRWLSSR